MLLCHKLKLYEILRRDIKKPVKLTVSLGQKLQKDVAV